VSVTISTPGWQTTDDRPPTAEGGDASPSRYSQQTTDDRPPTTEGGDAGPSRYSQQTTDDRPPTTEGGDAGPSRYDQQAGNDLSVAAMGGRPSPVVRRPADARPASASYLLRSGPHVREISREGILELSATIDQLREAADFTTIQALAADFFTPAIYVLGALGPELPPGLGISFSSAIPPSAGLGSGGAAFVGLAAALAALLGRAGNHREIAAWARRGDILAHGGVASGLDTQTSLYGGAIRYTAAAEGEPIGFHPGLSLVVGNSGVVASTAAVNGRVREWLAAAPFRQHHFDSIGLLARHGEAALARGDWGELGRLMNLNQLVLERIGVSCPELAAMNDAALAAGALGAKLSGSGGGGIMVALTAPERAAAVADAIERAGGAAIVAPVGVPGVHIQS
jgi:mevalonate kinase